MFYTTTAKQPKSDVDGEPNMFYTFCRKICLSPSHSNEYRVSSSSKQHTYLRIHIRRDTYIDTSYGRIPICTHGHRRPRVSCIRNRGRLDLPYDAGGASRGRREAGRYMCRWCGVVWAVEGGGSLPVRRHSYRGHGVELWRIGDWLKNDKKHLKVYLGFIRQKKANCVLDQ